jgi:hypothetical protein
MVNQQGRFGFNSVFGHLRPRSGKVINHDDRSYYVYLVITDECVKVVVRETQSKKSILWEMKALFDDWVGDHIIVKIKTGVKNKILLGRWVLGLSFVNKYLIGYDCNLNENTYGPGRFQKVRFHMETKSTSGKIIPTFVPDVTYGVPFIDGDKNVKRVLLSPDEH